MHICSVLFKPYDNLLTVVHTTKDLRYLLNTYCGMDLPVTLLHAFVTVNLLIERFQMSVYYYYYYYCIDLFATDTYCN